MKKKRKKKFDLLRGTVKGEVKFVGYYFGIPAYSSPKVPDREMWFVNSKGEIVGGVW